MTTETFSDFCVLWDHAAGKYVVALREDAKNHNAGMAMDKKGWAIPENLRHLAQPSTARQEASSLIAKHPEFARV